MEVILFLITRPLFFALYIILPLIYSKQRREKEAESELACPVKATSQFTNRSLETTFVDLHRSNILSWKTKNKSIVAVDSFYKVLFFVVRINDYL